MIWFKACPRCCGELITDKDEYGEYISCLQCGYYLSAEEQAALRRENQARRHLGLAGTAPIPARQRSEAEAA